VTFTEAKAVEVLRDLMRSRSLPSIRICYALWGDEYVRFFVASCANKLRHYKRTDPFMRAPMTRSTYAALAYARVIASRE
jgi:hypothetical protein